MAGDKIVLRNFIVKTEVVLVAETEQRACEIVEDWISEATDYQFISVEPLALGDYEDDE